MTTRSGDVLTTSCSNVEQSPDCSTLIPTASRSSESGGAPGAALRDSKADVIFG